jgi:hypothetical protein
MAKCVTGVLCISLASLLGAAQGRDPPVPIKAGMIIVVGEQVQAGGSQWIAYAWDGQAKRPSRLFSKQRPRQIGDMNAFEVGRNGQQYYLSSNNVAIYQADEAGEHEKAFFRHKGLVRDLALDNDDNVYFSEASGGGADGHIYRVQPAKAGTPASAELFCTVHLRDMKVMARQPGGFWSGNFAFARDSNGLVDTNTLYLSSGTITPAAIFQMSRRDGDWDKPKRVFTANAPIMGLVSTNPHETYFVRAFGRAGLNQLFRLTDLKKVEPALTLEAGRLWHVSVVPPASGQKASPTGGIEKGGP